ncbi:hypothetical protein YB2330_001716 [Saitoella coloradoensis]
MNEFPDGGAPPQEDFSSTPLPQRLTHTSWKVRSEAYEEAANAFSRTADESDPIFREFRDDGMWKKVVGDSNVVAMEKGIACTKAYVEFGGAQCANRTRPVVLPTLIEKALPSTRPGTKVLAKDLLLLYASFLDNPPSAQPILDDLIPYLSHKLPKLVAAATAALRELVHAYGVKVVPPKPVLAVLPKLFGHTDKNVRAEAQALTVELWKYLGEALRPALSDLKPVQLKELDALFNADEAGKAKPEKYLKCQDPELLGGGDAGDDAGDDGADEDAGEEMDAFDLSEPVDVLKKCPQAPLIEALGSSKWKDRKEALDDFLVAVSVPRIQDDNDLNDIVAQLARICQKDANVAVVTLAAQCLTALAKGLRSAFVRWRSEVVSCVMERLKERKASVVEALSGAMDAVFEACGLADVLENITETGLKHKNPQVKSESLKFLVRCLRTTPLFPSKGEQKSIAEESVRLLGDSFEPVRTSAAEALGTLMKIIGERAMNPYLEGVDDKARKAKIQEFFEKAEVKAKPEKPKPVAKAPAGATKRPLSKGPPAKPGLVKKPMVKRAPSPEPEPEEEKKPLAAKPTARRPPGATGATGVSRLTKPGLARPSSIARPPSSPERSRPTSAFEEREEEFSAPPAEKPRLGVGRGLTSRSLVREPVPSVTPSYGGAGGIDPAEKVALEDELRVMKREMDILRDKNAELADAEIREKLNVKTVTTQLTRARADLEGAREELARSQREMETLKNQPRTAMPVGTDTEDGYDGWKDRAERAERLISEYDLMDENRKARIADLEDENRMLRENVGDEDATRLERMEMRWKELERQNESLLRQLQDANMALRERRRAALGTGSGFGARREMPAPREPTSSRVESTRSAEPTMAPPSSVKRTSYLRTGIPGSPTPSSSSFTPIHHSNGLGYGRTQSSSSLASSEDKENGSERDSKFELPPPSISRLGSGASSTAGSYTSRYATSSGLRSPTKAATSSMSSGTSSAPPAATTATGTGPASKPIESWKRAAEVTAQLKQRIEQMKRAELNTKRGT